MLSIAHLWQEMVEKKVKYGKKYDGIVLFGK